MTDATKPPAEKHPLIEMAFLQAKVNLDLLNLIVRLSQGEQVDKAAMEQAAEDISRAITEVFKIVRESQEAKS